MKNIATFRKAASGLIKGFVLSLTAAFAVTTATGADYGLIVGVGNFDPDYQAFHLESPESNSLRMQKLLLESSLNEWTEETVTVLSDAMAPKGDPAVLPVNEEGAIDLTIPNVGIRSFLAYYAGLLQSGDTFVFYFSGLGGNYSAMNPLGKASYLCAYDGNYSESELLRDLSAFQPGVRVLVMMDAGHVGALAPLQETMPRPMLASYTQTQTENRAQICWVLSMGHDVGVEWDSAAGSEFTTYFADAVENLVGDAAPSGNGDGLVDAREAFVYANAKLPRAGSQLANAALAAQFVLGGDTVGLYKVEMVGSLTPTLGAPEPYECIAIYTNGVESAMLAEYAEKLAQFEGGLLEEAPELPEDWGRRVVIPETSIAAWELTPATAGTLEKGVLTLTDAMPGDALVVSASGTFEGQAWAAELEVVCGDAETAYAEALDNAVVVWTPEAWVPGSGDWFVDTHTTHDGEDSLQSAPVAEGQTVSFTGAFNGRGVLSFWYKVDAEGEDGLVVTVDGEQVLLATGETEWTQSQSLVGHGDHTVTFTYRRLSSAPSADLGRAWVDEVLFAPALYAFDMDANDNGWTTGGFSNLWERGVPAFGPVGDSNCWGTDLDGRYANDVNCWLMSPVLFAGANSILTFRTWFDIDNKAWEAFYEASGDEFTDGWKTYLDGGFVELSINGGGWKNVTETLTCPGNRATKTLAGTSAGWVIASLPLPEEAAGKSVRIRFRFATDSYVDSKSVGSPAGWFIDDVALFSTDPADLILVRTDIEDTAQGNNNGLVEPGESVWVSFDVANQSEAEIADLKGSVQCLIPGISLPVATTPLTYGDVAANAHAVAAPRLLVKVDESVAPGTEVRLTQSLTDAAGKSYTLDASFTVVTASSLEGRVTEIGTDNAIAGVTVSLGVAGTATTDASGRYLFPVLEDKTYFVSASAEGYSQAATQTVRLPAAGPLNFSLGKAYADLSKTAITFELAGLNDSREDSFLLTNALEGEDGTVPVSFAFEFPEGCPAWLSLDAQDGVILPGASRSVVLKVDARKVSEDPRESAIIRIVSNDCRAEFKTQDITVALTMEGLSNAAEYLTIDAFFGVNYPNQMMDDADGYLERGESGELLFSVQNGSLRDFSTLVVTGFSVVEAKTPGTSTSDISVEMDLAQARPLIASLPAGESCVVTPALEVSIANMGVEDPIYTIQLELEDPTDGSTYVVTGDYTVYDRHTVAGTVYAVPMLSIPERELIGQVANLSVTTYAGPNGEQIVYANPDDPADYGIRYDEASLHTVIGIVVDGDFTPLTPVTTTTTVEAEGFSEADYPSVDLQFDADGLLVIRRVETEFVGYSDVYTEVAAPTRMPVAEAMVYAVGEDSLVETVTLEDGTYVLHGLRNGYNKIYATRSSESALAGMSLPIVFGDLRENLPNAAYLDAMMMDPNAVAGFDLASILANEPPPAPPAEGEEGEEPPAEPTGAGVDLYIPSAAGAILEVVDFEVMDHNNDDVLEAGEEFKLSLNVGNVGIGVCRGFTIEVFPATPVDGAPCATFEPVPLTGSTIEPLTDDEGAPILDEEGNPMYLDLQLMPGRMASATDEDFADALSYTVTAGAETGMLPILVKVSDWRLDPTSNEWKLNAVWYSTLDLEVAESVAFSGVVKAEADPEAVPLAGVHLYLDKYDADDPSTVLSTSMTTSNEEGEYRFSIYEDFDAIYTVRPGDMTGYLAPEPHSDLPGDTSRTDLDFLYTPITGLTVSPDALEITHAEGVATTAAITIDNQTAYDVEVTSVAVRYTRTAADLPTAQLRKMNAAAAPDTGSVAADDGLDVAGELFVTFAPEVTLAQQEELLAAHGLQIVTRYRLVRAIHCRFDPAATTYMALREALLASGLVAKVDTVRVIKADLTSVATETSATDSYADLQWALCNERQTEGTLGEDIGVLPLWKAGITGSREIIVAVHDSGVDRTHPDLAANIWANEAELSGEPGVDDDNNGYIDDVYGWNFVEDTADTLDLNGHGTHVAGIIGAAANGTGTLGVNWNVRLMPIRVGDSEGGITVTSADLARSFEYMVENGAQVANCSWGTSYQFAAPVLVDAVRAACNAGLLVVVAAGNEAMDCDLYRGTLYGIQDKNMIVVAAADHNGKIAEFSNFGDETVHIAAPGVDILSTCPAALTSDFVARGLEAVGDQHVYMSGTSMAAPYVTGAAALLMSAAPDTPTSLIRDAILRGARVDPNLAGWVSTSAHLDIAGALAYLGAEWLVLSTELPLELTQGQSATLDFDVNPALTLAAGTYEATLEIAYTLDGQSQTLTIPVTDTVTDGIRIAIDSIRVDDTATGDGDGIAEPGEAVSLYVSLLNRSSAKLTTISGTLAETASAYPDLVPGAAGVNEMGFSVTVPDAGLAALELALTATLADAPCALTLPVELPVREAATVTGRVVDTTGAGVANAIVEFWTSGTPEDAEDDFGYQAAGRVTTDATGAYRIDGLASGITASLRAIPSGLARSAIATFTTENAQVVDLTVSDGAIWYMDVNSEHTLESTTRLNGTSELTFVVTNTSLDAITTEAVLVERKSILLISDRNGLAPLASTLRAIGFDVDVLSNNYECVTDNYGNYFFENNEHVAYSCDAARLLPYDMVVLDLDGDRGAGRQLTETEAFAIQTYLDRGGRILFTGGNLLSRPDDFLLAKLLGDASLDRIEATPATARPEALPTELPTWTLPGITATSYTGLTEIDPIALPGVPFAYDVARPALAHETFASADEATKVYRYQSGNGTLYYWGGNSASGDVAERGIWQDILRDLMAAELYQPVAWATPTTAAFTLAPRSSTTCTIALDAAGLAAGDYEASLLLFGAFDDAETSTLRVNLHVTRPVFTAFSNTGVTNTYGAFLKGDGQTGSYVYQLLLTEDPAGVVSAPDANGLPADGETVVATFTTGLYYGLFGSAGNAPNLGQFSERYEIPNKGTPVYAVMRAWTGTAPGAGAFWGDSAPYAIQFTENESHNFGSWCVGTLFETEGALSPDTNGDGVPDRYIVEHYPEMDPTAPLTIDPKATTLQEIKGSQLLDPYRVFATENYMYVLDHNQKRISVWTTAGSTGTYIGSFKPMGVNQFQDPIGLGKQPGANRFAVTDAGKHVVHIFEFDEDAIASSTSQNLTLAFRHVLTVGTLNTPYGQTNAAGEEGLFTAAQGVAMDDDGAIYVADTGKENGSAERRILVFNPDGSLRATLCPSGEATLIDPAGLDVDTATGDIYVANTGADNIVRLSASGVPLGVYSGITMETVTLVPQISQEIDPYFGRPHVVTNGYTTIVNTVVGPVGPTDVKVWRVGSTFRLLVADRDGNAIHVLDSNGKFVATFSNPVGSADTYGLVGNFRRPWGVFGIDDTNEAIVADTDNHRLQRLALTLDGDQDGIDDTVEMLSGRDPTIPDLADTDGDGITDAMELLLGTDPDSLDSDGDGLSDFEEINGGTDPLAADENVLKTLVVTALPAEGGSVEVDGGLTHPAGTNITLTATAAPGWAFAGWQDGESAAAREVRVGLYDNEYIALFERETVVVTVTFVDTNHVAVASRPDQAFQTYYGIAFHKDLQASFDAGYTFAGGLDSLGSKIYFEPIIDFESVTEPVTVTFIGELAEGPDAPEVTPPAIHATSIRVEGDDVHVSFSTDATELAQLYTFIDEGTSTASLIVAETLEALGAHRADPSVMDGIVVREVPVTVDAETRGFSIVLEGGAAEFDALFIVGFELP